MNIIAVSVILFGAVPNVVSGGVRVKGPLGGNASVHCSYDNGSESYPKYFSKGKLKTELVRLNSRGMWPQDSRFSLEDDKGNRVFTVTIRNLSVEDAGLYWCGVDRWLWDFLTEVNLDVVQDVAQDATSENAFVSQTTSSATITRQRTTEPQDQQTFIRDKSVHLGVSLAVVMLLCGTTNAIFFIMKNNKAKAGASTQSENYTEHDVDNCMYDKILPKNSISLATIQSPDSTIYATPTSSRTRTLSPPSHSEPAAIQGCSGETQLQHPEAVVYSVVPRSPTCPQPQSYAPIITSTQSVSLLYSKFCFQQRSHVLNDTSSFPEESHDVYATVQQH
ncbi:hypothetical protein PHYPO_G00155830 [Pangasianodon hypophthalmus]|uniref:Immunoglobulin domain-containing protein n=1 Tax=Pangasianodon hypophthalmus TaxID=310915 RepID=A0A5N5JX22_PANHP|nr:CMRF35-like molecule 6 [Pangasianodon hypophthalmus]KAB5523729.1 hypothetical protein PHYPO_G00155830 [Pangasianodon hypophthalmus]